MTFKYLFFSFSIAMALSGTAYAKPAVVSDDPYPAGTVQGWNPDAWSACRAEVFPSSPVDYGECFAAKQGCLTECNENATTDGCRDAAALERYLCGDIPELPTEPVLPRKNEL